MSTDVLYYDTLSESNLNIQRNNSVYARHQADYDYDGRINHDDDPADYLRPVKAVRIA